MKDIAKNGWHKEAIVCALVERKSELVGGCDLGSSADTYGEEYGWTAEDYRKAKGGIDVIYYTICIGVYSLNAKKFIKIAERLCGVKVGEGDRKSYETNIQEAVKGYVTIKGTGDIVVFHRSGNRLLDIGKYGIVDTLTGKTISNVIGANDKILEYDGSSIFFAEDYPATNPPVFRVNLEEGLRTGQFKAERILDKKEMDFENSEKKLREHHQAPFAVEVGGKKFTIDNQKDALGPSKIIAQDGTVIWKNIDRRYIVAAIGFPEKVLK